MAVQDILSTIRKAALQLNAILYERGKTSYPRHNGPQRYLFITAPQDLRAWRAGDDIGLVCLTDNRAVTFWSYVAEIMDDEPLSLTARSWTWSAHLAEEFQGYRLLTLPCAGAVTISHAPLPPHFDIALVDAYGLPDYSSATSVSNHADKRLQSVKRTLWECRLVTPEVVQAYNDLRESWAEPQGLLSSDTGPLNASLLFSLVIASAEDQCSVEDIVRSFFNLCSNQERVTNVLGTDYPATFLQNDMHSISVAAAEDHGASLTSIPVEPSLAFRISYDHYVCFEHQMWANSNGVKAREHLVATIQPLRRQLNKLFGLKTRLWPTVFARTELSSYDLRLTMLVAITGGPTISGSHSTKLVEAIEDHVRKHSEQSDISKSHTTAALLHRQGDDETKDLCSLRLISMAELNKLDEQYARQQELDLPGPREILRDEGKLRTAGQTLSRLRWDPAHQSCKYDVGYVDRFDGLKWLPLEQWGKPVEDDEFIPEHRIQQFRQASNGQIVWDRCRRLDLTDRR